MSEGRATAIPPLSSDEEDRMADDPVPDRQEDKSQEEEAGAAAQAGGGAEGEDAGTAPGAGEPPRRTNLGRGLAALFGDDEDDDEVDLEKIRAAKPVPIEHLHPNAAQPRSHFEEESLAALAESIAANGILQPILVRRHPERGGEYEIVAGERRWRAAQRAKLHEVPILVRELSDGQALEVALVENVQRQDLTPTEEADGYRRLMDEFGHTQEKLAKIVGKSRSHIANTLRLLNLPDAVRSMLDRRELTAGHARALLNAADPLGLAQRIARDGLTVRQAERLAQGGDEKAAQGGAKASGAAAPRPAPEKDADTLALENDLTALLGLKVSIDFRGQGGSLTIHYQTLEQLDDVLHRLNQVPEPA